MRFLQVGKRNQETAQSQTFLISASGFFPPSVFTLKLLLGWSVVTVLSLNVCIFTDRTAYFPPLHCKMTLSLCRISCLAQCARQTKLCDFGLVTRDT